MHDVDTLHDRTDDRRERRAGCASVAEPRHRNEEGAGRVAAHGWHSVSNPVEGENEWIIRIAAKAHAEAEEGHMSKISDNKVK